MSRAHVLALLALVTLAPLHPANAHHTFVIKYDGSKVVTISGVVGSVNYSNPHIQFSVQAGATTWTIQTESISAARSHGLTQSVLKDGAKVTVTGWPARDGSAAMGLHSITVSGGPSVTLRSTAR
jgi:hypothetical protein